MESVSLGSLSYKFLQELAKNHHIKANQKKDKLVEELRAVIGDDGVSLQEEPVVAAAAASLRSPVSSKTLASPAPATRRSLRLQTRTEDHEEIMSMLVTPKAHQRGILRLLQAGQGSAAKSVTYNRRIELCTPGIDSPPKVIASEARQFTDMRESLVTPETRVDVSGVAAGDGAVDVSSDKQRRWSRRSGRVPVSYHLDENNELVSTGRRVSRAALVAAALVNDTFGELDDPVPLINDNLDVEDGVTVEGENPGDVAVPVVVVTEPPQEVEQGEKLLPTMTEDDKENKTGQVEDNGGSTDSSTLPLSSQQTDQKQPLGPAGIYRATIASMNKLTPKQPGTKKFILSKPCSTSKIPVSNSRLPQHRSVVAGSKEVRPVEKLSLTIGAKKGRFKHVQAKIDSGLGNKRKLTCDGNSQYMKKKKVEK